MSTPSSPLKADGTNREGGFTLIELLIVLGILAVLVAVVLPSVSGFLGRGQEEALNLDERTIQAAVDAYYTDRSLRQQGIFIFPTSADGVNTGGRGPFWGWFTASSSTYALITFDWLVNTGYLRTVPQSASAFNSASDPGTYTWVIEGTTGRVFACSEHDAAPSGYTISGCTGGGPDNNFGFSGGYP